MSGGDLLENLKIARDYASKGEYQDSAFYYESVLSKINQYASLYNYNYNILKNTQMSVLKV